MKKLKSIYETIKTWLIANGVEGILGLVLGLVLLSFGYKMWAGVAFGVFATRNWDIFKKWVFSKLKY